MREEARVLFPSPPLPPHPPSDYPQFRVGKGQRWRKRQSETRRGVAGLGDGEGWGSEGVVQ